MSEVNDELDKRIIDALRHHEALRFAQLCAVLGINASTNECRVVDRALQRLRKRGAIRCGAGFWTATPDDEARP